MPKSTFFLLLLTALLPALSGCDPITRHKVVSTVFDGVPSLPPAEDMCSDFAQQKIAEMQRTATEAAAGKVSSLNSVHQPYLDKQCNNCHNKEKPDGLIVPKNRLCYECHTGFVKGDWVHGPISVSDCLACHEPHTSKYPKLLKLYKDELCHSCHKERRVAQGMHDKIATQGMICADCHDPHFGNVRFFLK